jgi:hypothetical protein
MVETKKIYRCKQCGRGFFHKESYSDHCKLRNEKGKCPKEFSPKPRKKKKKRKPRSDITLDDVEHWT